MKSEPAKEIKLEVVHINVGYGVDGETKVPVVPQHMKTQEVPKQPTSKNPKVNVDIIEDKKMQ